MCDISGELRPECNVKVIENSVVGEEQAADRAGLRSRMGGCGPRPRWCDGSPRME